MQVAKLTIDSTKVPSNQTDFPVYVDLSDMNAEFWSTVANGGGDIRIFKSDGTTELAREVVSCDTSLETGELHFKYTGTLSSSSDTEVQIHADGVSSDYATTDTYGAENVWTATKAVYHLKDVNDSSSNAETLTNNNTVAFNPVKIGDGADQGTSNTNKTLSRNDAYGLTPNSERSFTYWVSMNEQPGVGVGWVMTRLLFAQASSNYTDVGYRNNGGTLQLVNNTSPSTNVTDYTLTTGTKYKITITHDGDGGTGGIKVYVNNSLEITADSWNNSTYGGTTAFYIGADHTGGTPTSAEYDEFRIYDSVLSADWITTEYNNQNSPSTFYTVTDAAITISVSDTLDLTESISTLRDRIVSVSDNVNLTESISVLRAIPIFISETLNLSENISTLRSRIASVIDSLDLTENTVVKFLWNTVTKNTSTWTDESKNTSTWTNEDK